MAELSTISNAVLKRVVKGAVSSEPPITGEDLWKNGKTIVFVIRRSGCALCREHAIQLIEHQANGGFNGYSIVGIIKEVAGALSGVPSDEKLGVQEFQEKYFNNLPVYLDEKREFYKFLGNRSLFAQKLHSWNPFTLWNDYLTLKKRMTDKRIEGKNEQENIPIMY